VLLHTRHKTTTDRLQCIKGHSSLAGGIDNDFNVAKSTDSRQLVAVEDSTKNGSGKQLSLDLNKLKNEADVAALVWWAPFSVSFQSGSSRGITITF